MIDTDQVVRAILIAATLIVGDAALLALLLISLTHTTMLNADLVVRALLIVATLIVGNTAIPALLLIGPAPATSTGADQVIRAVPVAAALVPGRLASPGSLPPFDAATPVPAGGARAAIKAPAGEAPAAARATHSGLRLRVFRVGSPGQQPGNESAEPSERGSASVAAGNYSAEAVELRGIHALPYLPGPIPREDRPRRLSFTLRLVHNAYQGEGPRFVDVRGTCWLPEIAWKMAQEDEVDRADAAAEFVSHARSRPESTTYRALAPQAKGGRIPP